MAVGVLAVFSIAGPFIGMPSAWPSLLFLAILIAMYNAYFLLRLRRPIEREYMDLRTIAILKIALDLAALTVTVHFTGGLMSPVLAFFAFHMAIGTIMIATRVMFVLAGCTSVAVSILFLLEIYGVLGIHAIDQTENFTLACTFNLASLIVAMFGIIFLTHSVASQFKKRNIELYQATQNLGQRTKELQSALQAKNDLERRKSHYMRISAHQLRSPLATVKTSLLVLNDGLVDTGSDRGKRLLQGLADRVDSLLDIVNDLLELAKIREGRNKAPWNRDLNVNQLLADLFDSMSPLAEDRKVEFTPDFEGVAVLDWAIPPDLVYAFENLIHNAIKYSNTGGKVTVSLRIDGDNARVRVIDDGIGIPEEFHEQIFYEFVRTPGGKRHVAEGSGLGLPIVKEVVEAHGGKISLNSSPGKGSEFIVDLPLHYTPPEIKGRQ